MKGAGKLQKTVKGAQAQHIGKIVCGAGNEIDPEATTTHVTNVKRSGEWLHTESKNLSCSSKVNEFTSFDNQGDVPDRMRTPWNFPC